MLMGLHAKRIRLHMKEICGLDRKDTGNRIDINKRKYPCLILVDKQEFIRKEFKYFDMI
ncbi:hypothetical protein [Clostridium sp.]|uniref:hypothetical protein n=1 Tax=Clostridium sp. TaxID=1506 RepID=UPI003216D574